MSKTEKQSLVYPRLWQAIGWLMLAWVVILSLMPHPPEPPVVTWDKAQHLLTYGVLMFWFRMAFGNILWGVFLIGMGAGMEILQGESGYRDFEYADMLANSLGVLAGWLLAATPLGVFLARLDQWLALCLGRWVRS